MKPRATPHGILFISISRALARDMRIETVEFLLCLGTGWGGPVHDLAAGMAVWRDGPAAATGVLLSSFEFIQVEIEGVDECRDLLEGLELIRGAVMTAGIEAAEMGHRIIIEKTEDMKALGKIILTEDSPYLSYDDYSLSRREYLFFNLK